MRFLILLSTLFISLLGFSQTISTDPISGSYCQANSIDVSYTVTGVFSAGNSFVLQMSDEFGDFTTPTDIGILYETTSGVISGTIPNGITGSSNYRFRVISSMPLIIGTDNGSGVTLLGTQTSPNDIGINEWKVFCYSGYNLSIASLPYLGYYVDNNLNVNTSTFWPVNESPSSASNYTGCDVPYDNHTLQFKRHGFPCGYYTLNISALDNNSGKLIINGTQVWASPTALGNVWSGFLGPNSEVELIYRESTGNSRAIFSLNTTPFPILSTSLDACVNVNTNITASGANNYSWTPSLYAIGSTTNAVLTINAPSTSSGTSQLYTVSTSDTSGCNSSNSITVNFTDAPNTSVTPSDVNVCLGSSTTAIATGAATYSWSPSTGVSDPNAASVTLSPLVSTVYTVTGSSCGTASSALVSVNVTTPIGDTSQFGVNTWNAYCFNGSDLNTANTSYQGYYTDNNLSFYSNNSWPMAETPSNAASYQGCPVNQDYHTVMYKRKGFPCGYYTFNVSLIDNTAKLILDGTTIWASPTAGGNVYSGFLGPNSEITLIWRETTGNSRARLTLTNIDYPSVVSNNISICQGASATLEAFNGVNYQWVYNFNYTTGPYNTNTLLVSPPIGVTNSTQYYYVKATDPFTGCSDSTRITVRINPTFTMTVSPATGNTCTNGFVNATATGASSYTWSPMTGVTLNTSLGNSVTLDPSTTTIYTVTGSNGCSTVSKTVTITVPSAVGDTSQYGNNMWNVYAYNGTNPDLNQDVYKGFYTVNSLSFDSEDSWAISGAPSSAPGYQGCNVSANNHSVIYRREGFPCGYYQLGVIGSGNNIGYDNTATLKIDGVTVWSSPTTPLNNVWQGFLGPNSKIDFKWIELTGNSFGRLLFTPIAYPIASADVSITDGSSTVLTASSPGVLNWDYNTTFTSGPYNTNSLTVEVPMGTASQTQTYTVSTFDPTTNCAVSATINVNINGTTPLPVELIAIHSNCVSNQTRVNFATASERNNDYFLISLSEDGQHFMPYHYIKGAGNSTSLLEYEFLVNPELVASTPYLQLSQFDFDGKQTIFETIRLEHCSVNSTKDLIIYPNPAVDNIMILFEEASLEDYQLEIYSLNGKLVYHTAEFQKEIDVKHLENGVYLVSLTNAKEKLTGKFIKQ